MYSRSVGQLIENLQCQPQALDALTGHLDTSEVVGTFFRATAAINPDTGAVTDSNYLSYSNRLDLWTQYSAVVESNAAASPDGQVQFARFREIDSASAQARLYKNNPSGILPGTSGQTLPFVFSVVAKASGGTGLGLSAMTFLSNGKVFFDLSTGQITNTYSGGTGGIIPLGGGWYQCYVVFSWNSNTGNTITDFEIRLGTTFGNHQCYSTYGVIIGDAMVNGGTVPAAMARTTGAAITMPRYVNSGNASGEKSMLFEPDSTNYLLNSNNFSAWLNSSDAMTPTQNEVGRFGTVNNAWTLSDNSASVAMGKYLTVAGGSMVNGVFSIYIKKTVGATVFPVIRLTSTGTGASVMNQCAINTNSGAATMLAGSSDPTDIFSLHHVEDEGTFWRAEVAVGGVSLTTLFRCEIFPAASDGIVFDNTLTGSCVVEYGQFEKRRTATSIMPTTTATTTRSEESYAVSLIAGPLAGALPNSSIGAISFWGKLNHGAREPGGYTVMVWLDRTVGTAQAISVRYETITPPGRIVGMTTYSTAGLQVAEVQKVDPVMLGEHHYVLAWGHNGLGGDSHTDLYVDGELVYSQNTGFVGVDGTFSHIRFSGVTGVANDYASFEIRSCKIFNRVPTAKEVKRLYKHGR